MPRQLLNQVDQLKTRFGARESKRLNAILARLQQRKFTAAEELIHYHELLLFLRAYPPNASIRRLVERELQTFAKRVAALREADADLSPLDAPQVSGIAGTAVTDTFSYYVVRWLVNAQPRRLSLDWDWFDDEYRLAATWPRFMPLLEEDAFVEANVPYDEWLSAATAPVGKPPRGPRAGRDVFWLVERFESLAKSDKEKAELYDSLKLYVRWSPTHRWTRTGMQLPTPSARKIFFHREPLIKRRDVSLRAELEAPPPPLTQLSTKQGAAILDLTRAASTIRYRELYGFTHGDAARVFKVDLGRGVEVFVIGVPPGLRLPLRAYHAAMIFKNGVAVGYFEGISLFERMESGFNLYYTFRDGETAWLYARILGIFRHLLGVTAFSIDPYQIGYENAEGIESGAFWFYRKLGFRPTKPDIMKLVLREEKKLATRAKYRTSAATLRKLAEGPMIFELAEIQGGPEELPPASPRLATLDRATLDRAPLNQTTPGDWDRFQVRNIGLAATRRMAAKYRGDAETFRMEAIEGLARALGVRTNDWRGTEIEAFRDFAVTLSLVHDLNKWTPNEKQALLKIIRAKAGNDESRYLKLMQKHARLRAAMIKLGSSNDGFAA
jgi:hypothetical protein